MKERTAVTIQCQNQILCLAIQRLFNKSSEIQIVHRFPEEESAGKDEIDYVILEENELLRQWTSSLNVFGRRYVYVNPMNNCITVITKNRIELANVEELARLIIQGRLR